MRNTISIPGVRESAELSEVTQNRIEEIFSDPERTVTLLVVSQHEDDHLSLGAIMSHSNWQLRSARLWREAKTQLASHRFAVVVAEADLPDADWKRALADLAAMPDTPLLIVSSRTADERLWAEVLNLGGYDLLMKPFDHTEVIRVVGLAWLNWKRAMETARACLRQPKLALAAGM